MAEDKSQRCPGGNPPWWYCVLPKGHDKTKQPCTGSAQTQTQGADPGGDAAYWRGRAERLERELAHQTERRTYFETLSDLIGAERDRLQKLVKRCQGVLGIHG